MLYGESKKYKQNFHPKLVTNNLNWNIKLKIYQV